MDYKVSEKRAAAMKAITDSEKVQKALAFIKEDHERCVKEQVTIARLPPLPSMRRSVRPI